MMPIKGRDVSGTVAVAVARPNLEQSVYYTPESVGRKVLWVVEALNTAFEYLCDVVSPEFHPLVRKSKDIAAGAVLLSAVGAAAIGLIIFVPYLLAYL